MSIVASIAYIAVVSIARTHGAVVIFQTLASKRVRGRSPAANPCRPVPLRFKLNGLAESCVHGAVAGPIA
jgi:hypothetical protein